MCTLEELADTIAVRCIDSEGIIRYEKENEDGTYIVVCGSYSLDEDQDDDYFNGTGAWVCTDANVEIDSILYCDSEGNELEMPFNESDLEYVIEKLLTD